MVRIESGEVIGMVVREYDITEGLAKGAHVVVHDDCYAGIDAGEIRRRREEVGRAIRRIDFEVQRRGTSSDRLRRPPSP